jgi:hypothetical protein
MFLSKYKHAVAITVDRIKTGMQMFFLFQKVGRISLRSILGFCLMLFFVVKGAYAMQPPPPPLNTAQLRELISEANLIVVGKIGAVKETEGTVEVVLKVEKLLKGKIANKTIIIAETYRFFAPQLRGGESKDVDKPDKNIVSTIAGPNTYHGSYKKGKRIIVLLEKIEGTGKYRPLGSGTYDKYLCEFFIEDTGIKTVYFKFADDVKQYAGREKQFVSFIKRIIELD